MVGIEYSVSQAATKVLIQISKSSKQSQKDALAILQAATTEKNLQVCLRSIAALGEVGADQAIPTLTATVKRKEATIRKKAVESLGKIGPKSKTVVPALLEGLKEVDGDIRHFAVETLGSLGSDAKSAMPALIETLNDRDTDIQVQAVRALVHIDPKAKEVVPALERLLHDPDRDVRQEVLVALGQCGKPAVPALIESALGSRSGPWGDESSGAMFTLARMLEHTTPKPPPNQRHR